MDPLKRILDINFDISLFTATQRFFFFVLGKVDEDRRMMSVGNITNRDTESYLITPGLEREWWDIFIVYPDGDIPPSDNPGVCERMCVLDESTHPAIFPFRFSPTHEKWKYFLNLF